MTQSLFNKVADTKVCNFIKKRLQHSCFPIKFAKYQETLFLYKAPPVTASESSTIDVQQGRHHCWRLFLINLYSNFIRKRLQHIYFPVDIAKFLRTVFCRTYLMAASGFNPLIKQL